MSYYHLKVVPSNFQSACACSIIRGLLVDLNIMLSVVAPRFVDKLSFFQIAKWLPDYSALFQIGSEMET